MRRYICIVSVWFVLTQNLAHPSEVCPFTYDCLDVPDTIFAEYGRGTCPKSMRNGQTCSPKCYDSRAVNSGTFRCYRGHVYNSFRCHLACDTVLSMETHTKSVSCCSCSCGGVDLKGVQVNSSDDCKCRLLFPTLCRGTVTSRYHLLEQNTKEAKIGQNRKFPVETVVFSSIGVVLLCAACGFLYIKRYKPSFRSNRFSTLVELGENMSGTFNSTSSQSISSESETELISYHALE